MLSESQTQLHRICCRATAYGDGCAVVILSDTSRHGVRRLLFVPVDKRTQQNRHQAVGQEFRKRQELQRLHGLF